MKNQAFQDRDISENTRKLGTVLRRLTWNLLTDEQRQQIAELLDCRRQYTLEVCRSKCTLARSLKAENGEQTLYTQELCGSGREELPSVTIVQNMRDDRPRRTVYIYIPKEEDRRDEPRNQETKKT